jgi:hypothetical protein
MQWIILWWVLFLFIRLSIVSVGSRFDLGTTHVPVWSYVRAMDLVLPSRCLHNSHCLNWILSFNIFVIVLLILGVFWGAFSSDDTARLALIVLKVVWEPCALGRLMLLLQRSIICFTLPRNSWQLLLRLAHANSLSDKSRLTLILLLISLGIAVPLCWVTSHKPYLFILVLVMFNRQFGLRCVDLIALLTHAFGWDIVTLFFAFFAVTSWNLQMPSNKRGSKLILGDGCSQ